MPGNIGWQGLIVILLILLLVFGPRRLPEMGRSLGRGMREFKDSLTGGGRDADDDERRERPVPTVPPASGTGSAGPGRDSEQISS